MRNNKKYINAEEKLMAFTVAAINLLLLTSVVALFWFTQLMMSQAHQFGGIMTGYAMR